MTKYMATFSTVVFSFCQRECGFALGTILGMFVILPVRTIFRRFYSGYVAHYEDMGGGGCFVILLRFVVQC